MLKTTLIFSALMLAACAHGDRGDVSSTRGEPVSVNSVAATTPSGPSPTEMATTAASGSTSSAR